MKYLQTVEGVPGMILSEHSFTPIHYIIDGDVGRHNPDGNSQNMYRHKVHSSHHLEIWYLWDIIMVGKLPNWSLIQQGRFFYDPILKININQISGGAYQDSRYPVKCVALPIQTIPENGIILKELNPGLDLSRSL